MDFSIEKLNENRLHEFFQVFTEVLSTEFPGYSKETVSYFLEKIYNENTYRYYLRNHLKTIFISLIDNTIVGFSVIDEPYGGVSLCRWLGIKKEYQRKGLGSTLIKSWFNLAKEQGCHKVELAAQPEAKLFYEKAGLNLEGKRERSYFGIDQYIFGKVLGEYIPL